ncbi:MAG: glycogen debranching enzyme, partial [Chloroflexi bacterium]|nr:glycogen debranching enzyme [Chloroflexota bacterium]
DLTAYNDKHNEANGEDNRDGESHNRSWNCGAEGPTDNPDVNALRAQQRRNFLATLMFSQGIPMLLSGDEIARTQLGNNNAYCQDNALSWLDWEHADEGLLEFTRRLIRLRRDHPVFRRRRWFGQQRLRGGRGAEIAWLKPDGTEMTDEDWQAGFAKSIGMVLNGSALPEVDARGEPLVDDTFCLLLNAHHEPLTFILPPSDWCAEWQLVLDTSRPEAGSPDAADAPPVPSAGQAVVAARSLQILRCLPPVA